MKRLTLLSLMGIVLLSNVNAMNDNNAPVSSRDGTSPRSSTDREENIDALLARADSVVAALEDIHSVKSMYNYPTELDNIHNSNNATALPETPTLSPRSSFVQETQILELTIQNNPTQYYELTRQFLQKHFKTVSQTKQDTGNSPLHDCILAIQRGELHVFVSLTVLLELGAARDTLNKEGQIPFDLALASNNQMLIQLLTTEHPTKETLINLALEHGKEELMQWLIE